ncbi:ATP-binding cassette domain-containing protein [Anaerobacillus sp. CMMVII]|uniref:ATP-binding cassette domain-containing protein n=1 Tax=Anaerobacillus sp. CMMVII TaxID=2755588 RepID=UPI0021B7DDBD|nr:ATP-binding cassette domain-containing protein [Anaerobacillus sp. CMMVII]MCT8139741.1 ATP-binding cassette domain-containing protein [Anaerobacillus sp. CMMVII]
MNVLSMKHVWKKKETAFLLKDVSLFINDGEWLLISGPVGDGKEELKKVLLGFDNEYEGYISLHKKDIKSMEDYPAKIAFIHNHLIDENGSKTIYEYLAFPLRLEGFSEKEVEKRINHLLRQFSFSMDFEKICMVYH